MFQTLYLNNSGSKWIHIDRTTGKKEKINILTPEGKIEQRTALYYSSFGNFGSVTISWKGEKLSCLMDELPDGSHGVIISKWIEA